jgi:hypothetical protein
MLQNHDELCLESHNVIKPEARRTNHWTMVLTDTFALVGAMITLRANSAEWLTMNQLEAIERLELRGGLARCEAIRQST